MQNIEEQNVRRSTRNALVEIPVLSITDRGHHSVQNSVLPGNIQRFERNVIPTAFLSPSPSPDEIIIRQRGRRRIPIMFSPDTDEFKRNRNSNQLDLTPVKQIASPTSSSSSIILRSTPRKRLLLSDTSEINSIIGEYPSKNSPKKLKIENLNNSSEEEFYENLKALTSNQLIMIIKKLAVKHPELEKELKDIIPDPDIRPLEQHLIYLKRNVSKSLPSNRLCSKTDAIAYHRAATHLLAFKKTIFDQGHRLLESKQWNVIMDYIIMAWKLVRMIPVFDNPLHNLQRKQCFKFLANQCLSVIKCGMFNAEQTNNYVTRLENFIKDNDEIKHCLIHLKNKHVKGCGCITR